MPLSITLPSVGGDNGSWGTKLNTALTAIVAAFNGIDLTLYLPKAGGFMSGSLHAAAMTMIHQAQASTASYTLDLSQANSFSMTIDRASSFTISAAPGPGRMAGFVLHLVNGGAFSLSWPGNVKWPSGAAPLLTASGHDTLVFLSDDEGATFRATLAMKDTR